MKKWLAFSALFLICACFEPVGMVFPTEKWTEAVPEEVGIDSRSLDEAINFLRDHSGRDGCEELMIVLSGRLIYKGDSIQKVHGIWSCTKSFTSTVLGLLIDENKAQLSTLAKTILPEMEKTYPNVQLSHFATMTSGYKSVGDTATSGYTHGSSKTPFTPDTMPLFDPGTRYAYWDAAMNQFAHI
ncbi:MAG: serine hydrolase, partial [Saprospiraceae bacterium]|nr:serine hydrolase [Saprospiraceae bacterium]